MCFHHEEFSFIVLEKKSDLFESSYLPNLDIQDIRAS